MPTISVLIKPASGMCNMQCDYCFYCDEMKKRSQDSYGFMSEQTLKNVIRKTMIHAEGLISYVYQGGEPTLRGLTFFEKAVEYQRHYNKHGIRVNNALQTNGYLLDDAWCKFFKENQFLIGLSIDGTKQLHDMYRHDKNGNPTFDIRYNPNGSLYAIEGITSPDGRVLGKMGHSERMGNGVFKNVPGEKDQKIFLSGVQYFK